MGVGWRRFTERLQQGTPLRSRDFQPTSNARCATMLEEARQFVAQLKKCERAIRQMAATNADSTTAIRNVMTAPLPLRYEDTAAGGGGAARGPSAIGGETFSAEAMARATQDAGHKTEAEVLAPLQRWSDVYTQLGARFHELESLRLEVDSRRRTVLDLSHRVDSQRASLRGKGGDAKAEGALEQSIRRLQHKEGKLQVAAQSFADQEQLLHRDLSTLISDARWLKHYAAAALRLQGNALLDAAEAFGPLPGPTPPARKAVAPPSPTAASGLSAGGEESMTTPSPLAEGKTSSKTAAPGTPSVQPAAQPLARFPVAEHHVEAAPV